MRSRTTVAASACLVAFALGANGGSLPSEGEQELPSNGGGEEGYIAGYTGRIEENECIYISAGDAKYWYIDTIDIGFGPHEQILVTMRNGGVVRLPASVSYEEFDAGAIACGVSVNQ